MSKVRKLLLKITGYSVLGFGILLMIVAIYTIFNNYSTIPSILSSGDPGFTLFTKKVNNDHIVQIYSVSPNSEAEKAGVKVGDIITRIDGKPIRDFFNNDQFVIPQFFANTTIKITVVQQKILIDKTVQVVYFPFSARMVNVLIYAIIPLIFLLYVAVGIYGLVNSSFSRITILIALVCFSIGGLVFIPFRVFFNAGPLTVVYQTIVEMIRMFVYFTPSFWLFLFLNFPEKSEFYKKFKILTLVLVFVIPAFIIFYAFFSYNLSSYDYAEKMKFQYVFFSTLFMFISFGVNILHKGKMNNNITLKRRQYRLMLFGLTFGAISLAFGFIGFLVWIPFQGIYPQLSLPFYVFFLLAQCGSLVLPLTFLNSFYQHKLLETETLLKKRLLYAVLTIVILAAYSVGLIFLSSSLLRSAGIQDLSVVILLIIATAATFWPINNYLHKRLERAIFPDKTLYKELFREFSRSFPLYTGENTLMESVNAWFGTVMNVSSISVYSLSKNDGSMLLRADEANSILIGCCEGNVIYWDELVEGSAVSVNKDEFAWAKTNNIAVSVPIFVRRELTGIMNIGAKHNKDDFTGHEIEIFKSAAEHIGLALQTLILRQEYAEKKRLDRELEVARDIQMRLLPVSTPAVNGLDLYGISQPCLEVGGDYFDVIPLDDKRALLAIADVSGKGIGAAMLMANLQASLKIAMKFNPCLDAVSRELSQLVYENTGPAEFITFFCAIWNAQTGSLDFINAGHNPPFIMRANGEETYLHPTGIALGMMPKSDYVTGSIVLNSGDVLVMYTDGIEEAFNDKDEQFGLHRVIGSLQDHANLTPKECAESLLKDIKDFVGLCQQSDDISLIIVKRK